MLREPAYYKKTTLSENTKQGGFCLYLIKSGGVPPLHIRQYAAASP